MKQYFIIYFGEDGISIRPATREDVTNLIKNLTEERPDDNPFVNQYPDNKRGLSWEMEGTYPIYKYLIIQGDMVVPKAVKTVLEYKF